MRLFEFVGDDNLDRFTIILKNLIGRYASEKSPAKLNWQALNQLIQKNNLQLMADYETFKAIYDATPQIQSMVKNFNADGIELNIPGAKDSDEPNTPADDSEQAVDKMAAGAAQNQIDQNQTPIQV